MTGATGKLGGRVASRLLDRLGADGLGVCVRSPERVEALAAQGVRVTRGDYTDPAGLEQGLAGTTTLLLVSAAAVGEQALTQHRDAIEAARAAGVERIVYTSHQAADPASAFVPARDHAATEDLLAASGMRWTSLRDGFHADSTAFWLAMAQDGVLRLPADGPVSWTTHDDLADAAVALLLDDGADDGPTPALTGPEALDAAAVAERATRVTGTAYRREVVGDEEFVAGLVGHGTPEPIARMLLSMFEASRAGEFDVVDPFLPALVGHPATPLDAVLSAAAG
ncbi:NAD(P)H-binding protein [Nocardioides anomalus]|uniref:NAD(P)H-binding protein n=1 Tax=Nocardioides anomalus TaxID=2712223 RepID=UPI001E60AA88|nr:NAD(P)H-binding protein [Nocardioides anomalus]